MLKPDRQRYIECELQTKGSILVSELSTALQCSEETIRRDIKEMEVQGKLVKFHGGAYIPEQYDKGVPFTIRQTMLQKEKERMAIKALSFIQDHSIIMLDSSSTCLTLAQAILNSGKTATVITNSLWISNLFNDTASNINLVCLGGQLHRKTSSFTGYRTTDTLKLNYADISFISCPSAHIHYGLSDNNLNEAQVRKHMLENAHKRILLVDHTKIGSISDVLFYELDKIDILITDQKMNTEWENFCRESSIEVYYV